MEPEIEVFDDVMHVSRNRSFSLRMRVAKNPQKSCFTCYFYFPFFSSPIFLHAEVVAHWQINLLWSWLICMLPFFHTMLHWMSTTGSNRDGMQITSDFRRKIIGFLIYWFLKIYSDTTVFKNIPKCLNWKLRWSFLKEIGATNYFVSRKSETKIKIGKCDTKRHLTAFLVQKRKIIINERIPADASVFPRLLKI